MELPPVRAGGVQAEQVTAAARMLVIDVIGPCRRRSRVHSHRSRPAPASRTPAADAARQAPARRGRAPATCRSPAPGGPRGQCCRNASWSPRTENSGTRASMAKIAWWCRGGTGCEELRPDRVGRRQSELRDAAAGEPAVGEGERRGGAVAVHREINRPGAAPRRQHRVLGAGLAPRRGGQARCSCRVDHAQHGRMIGLAVARLLGLAQALHGQFRARHRKARRRRHLQRIGQVLDGIARGEGPLREVAAAASTSSRGCAARSCRPTPWRWSAAAPPAARRCAGRSRSPRPERLYAGTPTCY